MKLGQATPTGPSSNEVCKDVVESLKHLVPVEGLPLGNSSMVGLDSQTGLSSSSTTSSETSSTSKRLDRLSQKGRGQVSDGHGQLSTTTDNNQMEYDTPLDLTQDTPTNIGIKDIGKVHTTIKQLHFNYILFPIGTPLLPTPTR